jgi:FkbM family methyltransferase
MTASPQPPAVIAECHGVKVPDSPLITPSRAERITAARYEGQEIEGALAVIRPGDRVLEMGAGIGLVSAVTALNGQVEKVISFEANPALIDHIRALHDMNGLTGVIEVRNQILLSAPDAPDSVPFHVHSSFLGSSLIEDDDRQTEQVEVATARFDELREEMAPDVILMDIEGGELDFLRHASLEGVRAIVVEFHPGAYGIKGMRECKSILEKAGFAKMADHSTRHVWTCVREEDEQPPLPTEGWSRRIDRLDNAVVVPPADTDFVQPAGVLTRHGSYCPQGALWRNGRPLTTRPPMPEGDLPERAGTWLWGGVLWMHFGHFLVESASRLWALEGLEEKIDGILFVPKRPRKGSEVIGFQHDFARLMDAPAPLVCLDRAERVERLIVPGQGFGLGSLIEGTPEFRAAVAARFGRDVAAEGPEKLYISRSGLPAGRGNLIGEAELEEHLRAEGYTIYHPEKHDLIHQVATYKAAQRVIAAEGSALHLLAMVARADQQVAIVVRRPSGATRQLEQHLQSFAGISPLMVSTLTRSWKPLGAAKSRLWMGELDLPGVEAALAGGGFVSGGGVWPSLSAEVVQERLGERFEVVKG